MSDPAEFPTVPQTEPKRRFLIIGLDGATFDVLNPMMDAGRMPNLKRLLAEGASGVLHSTKPPITPAAWTTFMTGKGPGQHGIVDFEKYDVATNTLTFNSTSTQGERTLWEYLSEKGYRVGAINIPMTYPPERVNGFMISGFETPSIEADFTYPRALKNEILDAIPDYNYRTNWRRKPLGGEDVLQENLDYICNSFDQGVKLVEVCAEKYGWDVLMLVYKLVDNLQHKAWKYLDPRFNRSYPREAELAAQCFARLDDALGKLFAYADRESATVLIMSDHGHGSLDGKVQPNALLHQWGFLALRPKWRRAMQRAGYWVERLTKGRATRFEQGNRGIERDLAIDWAHTKACVMHAGIYGFLYINLHGRGPVGVVSPDEYEAVRDELIRRFLAVRVRKPGVGEIQAFADVYKAEQLYGCSREDHPNLPDLMLAPEPGLAVVRKIRGHRPVRWMPLHRLEGTHRAEGVFALRGPGIRAGKQLEANIIDCTPTVLAAMGLSVPADMEGDVLHDAFDAPLRVEREPAIERVQEEGVEVYSDDERELLEQRLSDLGYLE